MRVLMIGPGPQVRGGINVVIQSYFESPLSQWHSIRWLSTYDDRSIIRKILAALRAYMLAPFLMGRSDIVHIHGALDASSFLRKLPLIFLAVAMRKRVIFHVHDFPSPATCAAVIRRCLPLLDKVIALSALCAEAFQLRFPGADVVVIPNPLPAAPKLCKRLAHPNPRILFLGRIENMHPRGRKELPRAFPAGLEEGCRSPSEI